MIDLHVGGVPEHFNLPWQLAIETDRFRAAGANVTFTAFPGGTADLVEALEDGSLDLATLLFEGAIARLVQGARFRIVKEFVATPIIWGIHVNARGPASMPGPETRSRHVISRPGSGSHLIAVLDAVERGDEIPPDAWVVAGGLEGARQHLQDHPDDLFFWEKYMTQPLVDAGELRRIGERIVPWPAMVVAARNGLLAQSRSLVRRVLEALMKVTAEFRQDPAAAQVVASRFGLAWQDAVAWLEQTAWSKTFAPPEQYVPAILECLRNAGFTDRTRLRPAEWWSPVQREGDDRP